MTAITYKIGETLPSYPGSTFSLTASEHLLLEICGNLALRAQFNGSDIDDGSEPLSYDTDSNTFTIFTNDLQYVQAGNTNPYPYTLVAFLADYPDGQVEKEVASTVTFQSACPDLTCPASLPMQEYTLTDDPLTFSIP